MHYLLRTHCEQMSQPATNNFSPEKPSRLRYLKTGHRVRYLDDGSIQFLSTTQDEAFHEGSTLPVTEIEQYLLQCLGEKVDIVVESVTTSDSVSDTIGSLSIGSDGKTKYHGETASSEVSTPVRIPIRARKMISSSLRSTCKV